MPHDTSPPTKDCHAGQFSADAHQYYTCLF